MKNESFDYWASSGLGKDFAYILSKIGYDLVLVARYKKILKKLRMI